MWQHNTNLKTLFKVLPRHFYINEWKARRNLDKMNCSRESKSWIAKMQMLLVALMNCIQANNNVFSFLVCFFFLCVLHFNLDSYRHSLLVCRQIESLNVIFDLKWINWSFIWIFQQSWADRNKQEFEWTCGKNGRRLHIEFVTLSNAPNGNPTDR